MKQKTENRKPITSQLFGVPISITSKSQALATVSQWLTERTKDEGRRTKDEGRIPFSLQPSAFSLKIITTPNPEMIVAAQTDPEFLKALQSADLAIPDGIGIVWAVRIIQGRRTKDEGRIPFSLQPSAFSLCRLSGLDFMESLIRESAKHGWRVMLVGGKPGVAERVVASLRRKLETRNSKFETDPNDQNSKSKTVSNLENWDLEFVSDFDIRISDLQIRAISGPKDIAEASKEELDELLNSINHFRPDLLFVAFGHGKQEKWLAANRHRLNAGVAMGVGGALDQIADPSLRPLAYINSIGLGWLYRLLREPWRWKRQLALVKFVGMVLGKKFEARNSKLETNSNFQNPNAQNQQF